MPFGDGKPGGYEDGWSAPMDGSVFLANIEWRDAEPGSAVEPERPVRWGPVPDTVRAELGSGIPCAGAECFDSLDRALALRFFRGECWIHSWRSAPAGEPAAVPPAPSPPAHGDDAATGTPSAR